MIVTFFPVCCIRRCGQIISRPNCGSILYKHTNPEPEALADFMLTSSAEIICRNALASGFYWFLPHEPGANELRLMKKLLCPVGRS